MSEKFVAVIDLSTQPEHLPLYQAAFQENGWVLTERPTGSTVTRKLSVPLVPTTAQPEELSRALLHLSSVVKGIDGGAPVLTYQWVKEPTRNKKPVAVNSGRTPVLIMKI